MPKKIPLLNGQFTKKLENSGWLFVELFFEAFFKDFLSNLHCVSKGAGMGFDYIYLETPLDRLENGEKEGVEIFFGNALDKESEACDELTISQFIELIKLASEHYLSYNPNDQEEVRKALVRLEKNYQPYKSMKQIYPPIKKLIDKIKKEFKEKGIKFIPEPSWIGIDNIGWKIKKSPHLLFSVSSNGKVLTEHNLELEISVSSKDINNGEIILYATNFSLDRIIEQVHKHINKYPTIESLDF
jgi:hypothetical protein